MVCNVPSAYMATSFVWPVGLQAKVQYTRVLTHNPCTLYLRLPDAGGLTLE